jgi:putative hydrolase of the HAD superfamily
MIKAIVFDFDGVLVDSEKIWLNAKIKALRINNIKIKKKINIKSFIGVSSNIFFRKVIPKKNYQNIKKRVIQSYNNLLIKKFSQNLKLNKGIKDILSLQDIKFGIVSNNSKKFILKFLQSHKILKYFKINSIIALRNSKLRKPLPYGYLKILKVLNCKTKEILVIEDSITGIKAAKKAKIKYIFRYSPLKIRNIKYCINIRSLNSFKTHCIKLINNNC